MTGGTSRVIVGLTEPPSADVDLVLFPCAGGGPSMFMLWPSLLPANWRIRAVCLAGRDHRYGEPRARTLDAAANEVALGLADVPDVPGKRILVYAGHSMGSVVAYATAARVPPRILIAVAAAPPLEGWTAQALRSDRQLREELVDVVRAASVSAFGAGQEPDPDLIYELTELCGELLLDDLKLLETFAAPAAPLTCDIHAYYGAEDRLETRAWTAETLGLSTATVVPGDHFFPRQPPDEFLAHFVAQVAMAMADT